MRKVIEVTYANSMKINKGNYEQEAPLYSAKSIIEIDFSQEDDPKDLPKIDWERAVWDNEYAKLKQVVDPLLLAHYQAARKDSGHLRIRVKDGKKYPSVTSIINPDELKIDPTFGLRGTEIHRLINVFIDSEGKTWEEPKVDIDPLKYEDIKYKEWFEQHGFNFSKSKFEQNRVFYNEQYMFSGEIDLLLNDVYLYEFKTGSWKIEQLAAYWKSLNIAESAVIVDLKKARTIEFQPNQLVQYWEKFLILRGKFLQRFGI